VVITGRAEQLVYLVKDDVLPVRLTTEPRPTGSAASVLPDMELMLKDYYRLRKWDENGAPTKEALLPNN
jgi:aldehyde:ferredoxin oxidoreductase